MINPFKTIIQRREFLVPQLDVNRLDDTFLDLWMFFQSLKGWKLTRAKRDAQGQIKIDAYREVSAIRAFIESHE